MIRMYAVGPNKKVFCNPHAIGILSAGGGQRENILLLKGIAQLLEGDDDHDKGGVITFPFEYEGQGPVMIPRVRKNGLTVRHGFSAEDCANIPWGEIEGFGSVLQAVRRIKECLNGTSRHVLIQKISMIGHVMQVVSSGEILDPRQDQRVWVPEEAFPDFFAGFFKAFLHATCTKPDNIVGCQARKRRVTSVREVVVINTDAMVHRLAYRHGGNREVFTPSNAPWMPWPNFRLIEEGSNPVPYATRMLQGLGCY